VTVEAWKILKISEAVRRSGGRLTLVQLRGLVRGEGACEVTSKEPAKKRKGKEQDKEKLDLDAIAGGNVTLTKDVSGSAYSLSRLSDLFQETEYLIVHLLVLGYLEETYHSTSYRISVYLTCGPQALRLTRLPKESLKSERAPKIECSFRKAFRKPRSKKVKDSCSKVPTEKTATPSQGQKAAKRKRELSSSEEENGDDEDEDEDEDGNDNRESGEEDSADHDWDNEQAKTLCYGDVTLFLLPNPDGIRDLLGMEVDICHSKGHQRKPKRLVTYPFLIQTTSSLRNIVRSLFSPRLKTSSSTSFCS
jgi:ATP-dependent DNA helicase Q1